MMGIARASQCRIFKCNQCRSGVEVAVDQKKRGMGRVVLPGHNLGCDQRWLGCLGKRV